LRQEAEKEPVGLDSSSYPMFLTQYNQSCWLVFKQFYC